MDSEKFRELVQKGKEQGFLTVREVNLFIPTEIIDPEQINDIHMMIKDMGIDIRDE